MIKSLTKFMKGLSHGQNFAELQKSFEEYVTHQDPFALNPGQKSPFTLEKIMENLAYAGLNLVAINTSSGTLRMVSDTYPAEETMLDYFPHEEAYIFEAQFNQFLREFLTPILSTIRIVQPGESVIAIDNHDDAYYGKENTPGIIKGKYKKSTNKFYRYATVKICRKPYKMTLGAHMVEKGMKTVTIVKMLVTQAQAIIEVESVLLDGGYFVMEVMEWLDSEGKVYVIRAPKNNAIKPLIAEFEKTNPAVGETRVHDYEVQDGTTKRTHPIRLILVRKKDETKAFAVPRETQESPEELVKLFDSRFDIETGYRMKHLAKAGTTSKSQAVRFCLFAMSVVIYNFWQLYLYGTKIENHQRNSQEKPFETRMSALIIFLRHFIFLGAIWEVITM